MKSTYFALFTLLSAAPVLGRWTPEDISVISIHNTHVAQEEHAGLFRTVPSGLTCHLKSAQIDEQKLNDLTGYACTKVDCAPIKPGGKLYPCSSFDCADWAVNALFQKNYPTEEYLIDDTCYSAGIAQVSSRPAHFFVQALSSGLTNQDNDIKVTSNIAKIAPGKTKKYTAKNITLQFDKVGKTFFQGLWVAAAEGAAGCAVTAAVSYDFEGDGKWDRVETYETWKMAAAPAYENYNSGIIAAPAVKGGYLQDLKAGSVQLALSADAKCTVEFLQGATGGPPAGLTLPFKEASVSIPANKLCSYGDFETVFYDMHDGDQKLVTVKGSHLTITPHGNNQTWVVHSKIHGSCQATIDFNVPGKPSPPPVNLTATLYTMTNPARPSMHKPAIQFNDPSGTIAPPYVPLNAWIPEDSSLLGV